MKFKNGDKVEWFHKEEGIWIPGRFSSYYGYIGTNHCAKVRLRGKKSVSVCYTENLRRAS